MKEILKKHLKENLKNYLILMIIFIIGLAIGICYVNNMKSNQKEELNAYLSNITTQIKENSKIEYAELLKESVIKKFKYIAIIVFICFSIWGEIGTIVLILEKGFCVGYSISLALAIWGIGRGLLFAVTLIGLNEVVFMPIVFYITVLSIKNYKKLLYEKEEKNMTIIKQYLISIIAVIIMIIISSLIQTYLNNNLFLLFKQYY